MLAAGLDGLPDVPPRLDTPSLDDFLDGLDLLGMMDEGQADGACGGAPGSPFPPDAVEVQ